MKRSDVVVIGGSAAGIPAAITCRRHYPDKKVILIRKEKQVQIPCGIPYIYGTVDSPENNLIPDDIVTSNDIELFVDDVKEIDRENRNLITQSGETINYDKLVLATGSLPMELPIPGLDKENVFMIKKDSVYLKELLEQVNDSKDVVILGGGFIGVETATMLKKRGLDVTVVEMLPHILLRMLDSDVSDYVADILKENGIKLLLNDTVKNIRIFVGPKQKKYIIKYAFY